MWCNADHYTAVDRLILFWLQLNNLIIFRIVFQAFQDIDDSEIYAICIFIFFELISPEKFASYTSLVSVMFVLLLLLSLILDDLIIKQSTWRWVFLLKWVTVRLVILRKLILFKYSVSADVIELIVLMLMILANFPHHSQSSQKSRNIRQVLFKIFFRRVNFFDADLLLLITLLLLIDLEEVDIQFSWRSSFVIVLLTVSDLLWMTFFGWEWRVTCAKSAWESVFPWRFVQNRVWIEMLMYIQAFIVIQRQCLSLLATRSFLMSSSTSLFSRFRKGFRSSTTSSLLMLKFDCSHLHASLS